jgi:hypothetical protein
LPITTAGGRIRTTDEFDVVTTASLASRLRTNSGAIVKLTRLPAKSPDVSWSSSLDVTTCGTDVAGVPVTTDRVG